MGCWQEELDINELKNVDWNHLTKLSHKTKFREKTRIGNELAVVKHSPSLSRGVDEG